MITKHVYFNLQSIKSQIWATIPLCDSHYNGIIPKSLFKGSSKRGELNGAEGFRGGEDLRQHGCGLCKIHRINRNNIFCILCALNTVAWIDEVR